MHYNFENNIQYNYPIIHYKTQKQFQFYFMSFCFSIRLYNNIIYFVYEIIKYTKFIIQLICMYFYKYK